MKIKETKKLQSQRLKEICSDRNINYESIKILLESVKTKKLHSKRNYHQQKIEDIINKAIK
ncbi:hypothetical protein SAMN04489797_3143 [Winogradskyella sediminis]|uniref:Uncharacterized protein n=1 Tax=Winogradskyella sediminis TaxID=1382466 RepID=A0A1H1XBE9_9FLAO|nr:hypothetical protein SAMN04489797_3143 [Winogradskyella sediminis]